MVCIQRPALIVFARAPVPGQVKTRMNPSLSPTEAAQLQQAFLGDLSRTCFLVDAAVWVYYTPLEYEESMRRIFGPKAQYVAQGKGTLWQRMEAAFEGVFCRGHDAAVLVGSDCPEMSQSDLEDAFTVLADHDCVFGPAKDGGYYLVGLRQCHPGLLNVGSCDPERVWHETLCRVRAQRLSWKNLRTLSDMDTVQDLRGLMSRQNKTAFFQTGEVVRYLQSHRLI